MIDIHSHVLPFVDDGSNDNEKSLELLKTLVEQGVSKVICTPHYKRDIYELSTSLIKKRFNEFCALVKEREIPIELYLGSEILCEQGVYDLIRENKVLSLNGSKYVLLEFDYFNYADIVDYAYNIKTMGYIPVIAHIERYSYLSAKRLIELREMGALIQVNSSSITGESGKEFMKKAFATIKAGFVDFIASDAHVGRNVSIQKAYKIIKRKFGTSVAEDLFINNAEIFDLT